MGEGEGMRRGEGGSGRRGEKERERGAGERVATVNELLLLLLMFDDCNAEKREWMRKRSGKGNIGGNRKAEGEMMGRNGRGIDLYVALYDCITLEN